MDARLRSAVPPPCGASDFECLKNFSGTQNTTCHVPMHIKSRERDWALALLTFDLAGLTFGLADLLLNAGAYFGMCTTYRILVF